MQAFLPSLLTAAGVILGGIAWMVIYATNFGQIEYDGPAGLGLALALLVGGTVFGLIGIMYGLKQRRSIAELIVSFLCVITFSLYIVGFVINAYAIQKWNFTATDEGRAICQSPEGYRRAVCQ